MPMRKNMFANAGILLQGSCNEKMNESLRVPDCPE